MTAAVVCGDLHELVQQFSSDIPNDREIFAAVRTVAPERISS